MAKRFLLQINRHLDILALLTSSIFIAGMAWSNVSSALTVHEARITKLESDDERFREVFAAMKQEVDDIHERVVPNDHH